MIFHFNLLKLLDKTKGTEKVIGDICKQLASVFKLHLRFKRGRSWLIEQEEKCQGIRKPGIIWDKILQVSDNLTETLMNYRNVT